MDKCILVENVSCINSVVSETFKATQRIKLTCFDVSEEYIVFGTSSGGIYIFKREPCEFFKIIPSKEGSSIKIAIAPKEKNMAIASSRGLVIILEDFLEKNIRPLIHNEHEGSIITAMKWHGNTIYTGDDSGKVALFSSTNLLTIFQTASATIMKLDSHIFQIDAYLNYLLISTETRTYLCDTEKECYKQIGKKLREGHFGACFFNVISNNSPVTNQSVRGIFRTMENESFVTPLSNSNVKIYCARPGARLWEANFDATVLVTHQFRDSLNQTPSDIIHFKDDANARLNISTFKSVDRVSKNFNFSAIYSLTNRFVCSFDNNCIFFFDPIKSKLAFWGNCFKNIRQIVILGSSVYIWQDNLQITVLSVELLDDLIVKTLINKQYYFCAELITTYNEDVMRLIEYSKKIHLISILKSKLAEISATVLLEKVTPILQILEKFNKRHLVGKKLSNGIVVIENPLVEALDYNNVFIPESVINFDRSTETSSAEKHIQSDESHKENNTNLLALYRQFKLNETHKTAELTESTELMNKLNLEDLLILLQNFRTYVENTDNSDANSWCKEQFLKQASKKDINVNTMTASTLLYLQNSFLEFCNSKNCSCKCGFPLPKAHKERPEYYDLGCILLDSSENISDYLYTIPYMHRYFLLKKIMKLEDAIPHLPLIVQFSDKELLERYIMIFTYDIWDGMLNLYIKLKKGRCLNCEGNIELDGIISWSVLGMLMIKSLGPQNTVRLLKRYSQHILNGSLGADFYQCCILASTFDQPGVAVNFVDTILTENVLPQFEDQMEKFLQKKFLRHQTQPLKCSTASDSLRCTYCDMPLQGSIFSDSKKCDEGHTFHSICFTRNQGICNVCSKT